MSKSISGSRAWAQSARKSLFCSVLAAISGSGLAFVSAAEGPVSRWSTANPPTPAAVDALPPVPVASRPPVAAEDTPGGIAKSTDVGLRRLPPIEDTQPTSESETAGQKPPAPAEAATSQEPSEPQKPAVPAAPQAPSARPEARPAAPVDWTNPHVVIGPEPTSRTVSHEEMISTPPEFDARASRFSRIADGGSDADQNLDQDQMAAHSQSRYSASPSPASPPPSLQPVSPLRQPVFARVFDETVSSDDATEPPTRDVRPSEGPVAQVSETLSPIFACRLLGLPATQERASASRPGERTTTR